MAESNLCDLRRVASVDSHGVASGGHPDLAVSDVDNAAAMLSLMENLEHAAPAADNAKLRNSTTVFLVGNIEPTMEWYKQLGFTPEYYPPGFAILRRDDIEIFLQQQPGYVFPEDSGRLKRQAWNVYIVTNDVKALHADYSALPGVKVSPQLCEQEYGMTEFDVIDLNGHRLVFAQPTK